MIQVLFLHQLRFDVLAMRRNRRSQFFILLLPLLLLSVFAGPVRHVDASRSPARRSRPIARACPA